MRSSFNIFTVEGRKHIRRNEMSCYVDSWLEAIKLILYDSGFKMCKI